MDLRTPHFRHYRPGRARFVALAAVAALVIGGGIAVAGYGQSGPASPGATSAEDASNPSTLSAPGAARDADTGAPDSAGEPGAASPGPEAAAPSDTDAAPSTDSPAAATDGNDPFRGGTLPAPSDPALALTEHLVSEARIFHDGLTRLAGTATPCAEPCNRVDDPVLGWTSLGLRCEKLGLEGIPAMPAYSALDHAELHAALTEACGAIDTALGRAEPPQSNATWRTLAEGADLPLAQALAGR